MIARGFYKTFMTEDLGSTDVGAGGQCTGLLIAPNVDVPALVPDGTPAASSINATLQARGDRLTSGTFELGKVDTSKGEEK